MGGLNPEQRAAIRYVDGPLLVLAGAGSGKTRVITHKIAHLVDSGIVPARRLAALTFTNKAAREMKARVAGLARRSLKGLRISTFHRLGLDIVRHEHHRLGYRAGLSLLDTSDAQQLVRELCRGERLADHRVTAVQQRLSNWKNELVTPESALASSNDEDDARAARIYARYDARLKAYNAVDFDDLIAMPVALLHDDAEARGAWQGRIRYLLVDEYQDTNTAQYRLVRLLAGADGGLTAVGDDDQSIYAWRGARPDNLTLLRDDYSDLKVMKLEHNYRSAGVILKAANALIANNPHVFPKALRSTHGYGEPIPVIRCRDEDDEARRVVERLLAHRFQGRAAFSDYAILYRGNHQAKPFERILREHDIPHYLSGGRSFFDTAEIKDVLAYVRLLANPCDDAAFLRVVNTPRRDIGATTVEHLAHYARDQGVALLDAALEAGAAPALGRRAAERLQRFGHWIVERADTAGRGDPAAVIRDVVDRIGYRDWLETASRDERAAARRQNNVLELLSWLERLGERDSKATPASLASHVVLVDVLERRDEARAEDRVALMTLHAAKGLEFKHVFLVGFEEQLLPHRTAEEDTAVQEERRLAYVGFTRAMRTLTVTLAATRRRHGERRPTEPSRFLSELPTEDLRAEGFDGEDRDARQARGRAALEGLRGFLSG